MNYEELENLKREFKRIKKMGYIKNNKRMPNTKVFTSLLEESQYINIDIRNKGPYTRVYTSIFNKTPEGEEPIKRLFKKYSYQDSTDKRFKILETSVQANCSSFVGTRFLFKLQINYEEEKVYLAIYDRNFSLIEKEIYWSFKSLKESLAKNFRTLALVKSWTKTIKSLDYYKYYDIEFFALKDFTDFLKLLEDGTIRISLKIGTYHKGTRKGQIHDFGTSFEIQELDLEKLYTKLNL